MPEAMRRMDSFAWPRVRSIVEGCFLFPAVGVVGAVGHRVVARGRFAPVVPAGAVRVEVAGAAIAGVIAAAAPVIVAAARVINTLGEPRAVVAVVIAEAAGIDVAITVGIPYVIVRVNRAGPLEVARPGIA